ncbi:Uncharacterised protein [Yersinia enterocolitica]|nr:Uncharacterised protein [Yersinia enterocolitica]
MVGDQHHAAGVFNNRPLGAHFMVIKLQQGTVHINAANTEDAVIKAELRNEVQCGFTNNSTIAGTHFAARQNQTEIFFSGQ